MECFLTPPPEASGDIPPSTSGGLSFTPLTDDCICYFNEYEMAQRSRHGRELKPSQKVQDMQCHTVCVKPSSLSLDLDYLFSIASRSPLLHSISKLSSPNPYLPFLVEMYLRFRCLMGFFGLVFAGIYQQVFTPISSITEEDYEMSDCVFFFLLSSLKRLTICRGSDQAVVPLPAQTLSKLRPSLEQESVQTTVALQITCIVSYFYF
ncbi:hypothetical protein HID58_083669 [Brassica napus]|uniref:Uncharacterized protein n=1 Tax=Brassica napus TaxID=3708 RepID=A0ABQ7YGL2_BRANA|nr:hypothetical protein HID58_083669 [Brassica napus]